MTTEKDYFATRMFPDRESAEREYRSLTERGYGARDINVLMTEDARRRPEHVVDLDKQRRIGRLIEFRGRVPYHEACSDGREFHQQGGRDNEQPEAALSERVCPHEAPCSGFARSIAESNREAL